MIATTVVVVSCKVEVISVSQAKNVRDHDVTSNRPIEQQKLVSLMVEDQIRHYLHVRISIV